MWYSDQCCGPRHLGGCQARRDGATGRTTHARGPNSHPWLFVQRTPYCRAAIRHRQLFSYASLSFGRRTEAPS